MDVDIDLANMPEFRQEEWIGVGKKYPKDPPLEIHWAKRAAFAIPESLLNLLPHAASSVSMLLQTRLPEQSSKMALSKDTAWFSPDPAATDPVCLLERPIPSKAFLAILEKASGQAWFDKAQSVVDRRYNDGRDRLPLCAMTLWTEMVRVKGVQEEWRRGIIGRVKDHLRVISWDAYLQHIQGQISTRRLATFLGTAWLSDDEINLMMEDIAHRITAEQRKDVLVAKLDFSNAITAYRKWKGTPSESAHRRLGRYEDEIKAKEPRWLYFPVHVNGNHWICVYVDFEKRTYGYGDSLSGFFSIPPLRFFNSLNTWLKKTFSGRFKNQGESMPCGSQSDSFSCGIVAANAIEHAVFDTALWTRKRAIIAVFFDKNPRAVQCSACGQLVTLKSPYNATRWREHRNKRCKSKPVTKKQKAAVAALKMPSVLNWLQKATTTKSPAAPIPLLKKQPTVPCPGLTELDNSRIPVYLRRSGAKGGGARSLWALSMERFGKAFSELDDPQARNVIFDVQINEFQWQNDHDRQRVHSTTCALNNV
ncbi:hypothetical protein HGRIS_009824 [Hohenbuehelia grisea]|uniref:Ubiquitin-like protease family profile domain-containing protein n=1 Tax=Hohenbuehelia grisea TaxID=104357 RepID=A0ABR3J2B1_9AGAR